MNNSPAKRNSPNNAHPTAPRYDAAKLREQLDFQAFYLAQGHSARGSGRALVDRVPWREDRQPSFNVYPNGWIDRATGEHGDVFDYLQRRDGCSFVEAVEYVARWLNQDTQAVRALPRPHPAKPSAASNIPSAEWQTRANRVVKDGIKCLWRNIRAVNYLRNRGLKSDTIRAFRLGYDPKRGIIIPWYQDGELLSVRYRRHVGAFAEAVGVRPVEGGKYDCLKGSKPSAALFNAGAIRPDRPVVIVEGEFDAMLGQQIAGDLAVFVTRGSASVGKLHNTIKDKLNTATRCLIVLDNDGAGSAGTRSLAEQLPNATAHQLPSGKDLTEFVMLIKDNLRAWLTDVLSSIYLSDVSDGIRQAAWNCKLNAALIAYELVRWAKLDSFTKPDLIAIGQKFGIPESTIRRGVDQGVGVFLSKSVYRQDFNADFERKAAPSGRTPDRYQALSQKEIVDHLASQLPYHLIRKHFTLKGRAAIIPEPTRQLLAHAEISQIDTEHVIYDLKVAYGRQNAADAQRHYTAYRRDLQALLQALQAAHSTPIKWVQDCPYESLYLHAVQCMDPADRSCAEYAQMIGKRPNNIGRIVKLAGIKSTRRPPEYVPLPHPEQVVIAACTAAKGQGAILKLVAQQDGQKAAEHPFDRATAQTWATEQIAQGRAIGMLLARCNKQEIISEPVPVVRVVRLAASQTVASPVIAYNSEESPLPTLTVKPRPKPAHAKVKAAITDDPWLRDYLLRGYCLNQGIDFEALPRESLTITDAVNLLLNRVELGLTEDDALNEQEAS